MNCELPDVQPGFRKGRGTRDQNHAQKKKCKKAKWKSLSEEAIQKAEIEREVKGKEKRKGISI